LLNNRLSFDFSAMHGAANSRSDIRVCLLSGYYTDIYLYAARVGRWLLCREMHAYINLRNTTKHRIKSNILEVNERHCKTHIHRPTCIRSAAEIQYIGALALPVIYLRPNYSTSGILHSLCR